MFDEKQKNAVIDAYNFAIKVGQNHIKQLKGKIPEDEIGLIEAFRSSQLPEELKKRVLDLAIEYHYCKKPSSDDGLAAKLGMIELEVKGSIDKLEQLKNIAPDTFDDVASTMYDPYLRGGELKARTFEYYDPQIELKHLLRAVQLAKSKTLNKSKKARTRGLYWERLEQIWSQLTCQRPKANQNSDFITFSDKVFNAGKKYEESPESTQALSKDYKRYLKAKSSIPS